MSYTEWEGFRFQQKIVRIIGGSVELFVGAPRQILQNVSYIDACDLRLIKYPRWCQFFSRCDCPELLTQIRYQIILNKYICYLILTRTASAVTPSALEVAAQNKEMIGFWNGNLIDIVKWGLG